MTIDGSTLFKYKAALVGKTADVVYGTNSSVKDAKIVAPLKYLSSFWRSLEMSVINGKVYLELNWIEDCILSSAGNYAKFEITDAKLHVPIVTLFTKVSEDLARQLSKGFIRSVYWNSYETRPAKVIEQGKNVHEPLNASFQFVRRLFALGYAIAAGAKNDKAGIKDNKEYFLSRGEIQNYNVLIDGRNVYDQPINDLIKQCDEVRKVSTGYGDDYTTNCLLDYAYFSDNFKLIAVDLIRQKALDADPETIQ